MSITLTDAQIPPSIVAALVARLRDFVQIMQLCPDETVAVRQRDGSAGTMLVKRVSHQLEANQKGRAWTGHALVVKAAGGDGRDPWVPLAAPTIDVLCHGVSRLAAERLALVVVGALEPVDYRDNGFVQGDCAVADVHQIAGAAEFFDRDNQAHIRALQFAATYWLIPAEVPA